MTLGPQEKALKIRYEEECNSIFVLGLTVTNSFTSSNREVWFITLIGLVSAANAHTRMEILQKHLPALI